MIRYWSYIPTMLAAINTALIAFGTYHFNDPQMQALVTLASVVGTVVGVHVNNTLTKPAE